MSIAPISQSHPVGAHPRGRRKTIAVFLDYMNFFGGGYEGQLRGTFDVQCRERDLDLLLVFGRAIGEPRASTAQHNAIFDLMRGGAADGIVVVTTLLSAGAGEELRRDDGVPKTRMAEFVERFRGIPLVSFGVALPGVPSVTVDNRAAMEGVIEHMIRQHGARRIALIAGTPDNPEALTRKQAYTEVLARHGIPYDESLVETGYFMKHSGYAAMERILARGCEVDAVVAANDSMALGAIDALRAHGKRVPKDARVTGFDDLALARLGNPPLTTVAQPFEAMVERALDLVLAQIDGKPVAECQAFVGEVMVRQSCGCGYKAALRHRQADTRVTDAAHELSTRGPEILAALTASLRVGPFDGAPDAIRLMDGLRAEIHGDKHAFIRTLEQVLDDVRDDNERYRALQNAISCLRGELYTARSAELDEIWHEALSLVALANTTAQVHHRLAIDENYLSLLAASERASVAHDIASLAEALERSLPLSGVKTAFISRYVDASMNELEQFVGLVDGAPVRPLRARFPAHQLIAPGSLKEDQRRAAVVFPLAFEAQALGVAVFEYVSGMNGQHVLRDQISAALRNVYLHEEMVQKTTLHERSVQERAATAKRMQSLSVLAGGVAHDLNNVLGPLVALPDVIRRELGNLGVTGEPALEIGQDIDIIKSAALRAAQTIKDLLTLGRQGRAAKEPIELNRAVAGALTPEVVRFMGRANPDVDVELHLSAEPLVVRASEAHISRAINNLVRNAIEAMSGGGKVKVRSYRASVAEPISGYETIDPGDYAVVSVSDLGSGIAPHELGRIFEPFFSKKRVGDHSGTGLGLAIVHGVVKEHDGFVDVVSTLGGGTTFTLYFPRSDELLQPREPVREVTRGRASVLIVDDEPVQLRAAKRVLGQLGYRVETLGSGRRARETFQKAAAAHGRSPFDLVVLDMALNEEHDGYEVFEQIRDIFPDQKAIIASGHAANERIALALGRGLAWLPKPYTAEALASAVHAALAERPSLRVVRRSLRPSAPVTIRG